MEPAIVTASEMAATTTRSIDKHQIKEEQEKINKQNHENVIIIHYRKNF